MNWAQRRKLTYVLIVLAFFGIVGFTIYHKATDVAPTCFDHKQNGDETGVDCGGSCVSYCANELNNPTVEWVRVFPVTPGIVDAVAYIEHGYPTSAAQTVSYDFKLYDAQNVVLADRTGSTYLGTAGKTAIVETLIHVSPNDPVALARFSFTNIIPWQKVSPSFAQVVIDTTQNHIDTFAAGANNQVNTRLTATIKNESRISFSNLDVVAILYDDNGNAITASKVLLPSLPALQSQTVYFTWPYQINNVAKVEVIPRYNLFTAQSL